MMRFVWNTQRVTWFRNAARYTGYHQKLAQLLLEHIPSGTSLCDLGCGTGDVDFVLASRMSQITCVDIDPCAVAAVEREAMAKGIDNLTAICGDAGKLTGRWDTVMALFHGGSSALRQYLPYARDRLLMAVYVEKKGDFGPKHRKREKRDTAAQVLSNLTLWGAEYTMEEHFLEYGQPLRDWQEAEAFVSACCQPMPQAELEKYLQDNLEETGRDDFPYYLPKQKRFQLFVLRREENQHLWDAVRRGGGV